MFGLFKKKEKKPKPVNLLDLDNNPLQEGDIVISLRYDMGKCRLELSEGIFEYLSLETGQRVSYTRMIDAITENQKVKKVIEEEKEEA